jgi:hypothetical protein
MSTSTITLDGSTVTLVSLPTSPAPRMVEPWISDSVAIITSVFTGQTQSQGATGADLGGMMVTYPPLTGPNAAPILAWLMQMRGMARAVQLTPPEFTGNAGTPHGTPVTLGAQVAAATTLSTSGWTANTSNLLLPYDLIQIGYRLYRVLDTVNSDSSGDASFEIFPSLRNDLNAGTPIVTANPRGLYRLASNKRNWSADYTKLVHVSFPLVEYR